MRLINSVIIIHVYILIFILSFSIFVYIYIVRLNLWQLHSLETSDDKKYDCEPQKLEYGSATRDRDNFRVFLLSIYLSIYLSLLSRSISDHHLRCGGWLNLEFSKREKHSGLAIKTIYKK